MLDLLLHADTHLAELVASTGPLVYVILFLVIFAETGLVVTPFLPGDSLLFAAGALGATGAMSIEIMIPSLIVAAVLGDAVNYSVGARIAHWFLPGAQTSTSGTGGRAAPPQPGGLVTRLVKPEHVQRAHEFFLHHGGKAVVLARFVPIVRTFLPFVAGGADMPYRQFAIYNVTGAVLWVGICTFAGYLFGNIPIIKQNFSLVVLGIVFVSVLPIAFEVLRGLRSRTA